MQFANPVASDFLTGGFYDEEAAPYYLSPEKLAGDFAPTRFEREIRLVRAHCRGGALLDVGCNTGAFLHQLQLRHPGEYKLHGVDVSGPALAHATKLGLSVSSGPLEKQSFPESSFSAVTFWAVLEHLGDPLQHLRIAARLLKSGGHAFVLVPNHASLVSRLLGARYRYVMPEHLNYFTAHTLRRLIEAVREFELVAIGTSHFNPVVLWQDWRRPRLAVPPMERAQLLARTNRWKRHKALLPIRGCYQAAQWFLRQVGWADNLTAVIRRRDGE